MKEEKEEDEEVCVCNMLNAHISLRIFLCVVYISCCLLSAGRCQADGKKQIRESGRVQVSNAQGKIPAGNFAIEKFAYVYFFKRSICKIQRTFCRAL